MVTPYSPNGWYQPQQVQTGQLKGRPVTSIEEVKGSMIEFDGSVFYFPDLANKKIYTKQINLDGTSTINMYELKPIPQTTVVNSSQYITRDEFETVLKNLQQEIQKVGMVPASTPIQGASSSGVLSDQPSPPNEYKF